MLHKRTSDLAAELFGLTSCEEICLSSHTIYTRRGFKVACVLTEQHRYHTVTCGRIWQKDQSRRRSLCRLLSDIITEYREDKINGATLIVGLGSAAVTADSLGPLTAERIIVTGVYDTGLPKTCAFIPGVPARTGIDTAAAVSAIAEQTGAGLIITVDSLSALSPSRLCTVIQISDCGVIPGSATSHSSGEISSSTMPCPVISVGVPTVIRADLLSDNQKNSGLLVSSVDTDVAVSCYASVIAGAINLSSIGNTT